MNATTKTQTGANEMTHLSRKQVNLVAALSTPGKRYDTSGLYTQPSTMRAIVRCGLAEIVDGIHGDLLIVTRLGRQVARRYINSR